MTTPIKNSGTTTQNNVPPEYPDYTDYNPENPFGDSGGDYVDNSGMDQNLSVNEVRKRIEMMETTIRNDTSLKASQKQKMIGELEALSGRVNYSVCLDSDKQAVELQDINQQIGTVESEAVQDPSLTNPPTTTNNDPNSDPGNGNTIKDLKAQSGKIQEKLDAMLSDGKISQDVYDTLNEKLSRMNSALDGVTEDDQDTKDTIQQTLSDISDTVGLLNKDYLINGEQITEIPGDAPAASPDTEQPEILKNLMSLLGDKTKSEDVLKVLQKHYPSLDKNGDGKIDVKELKAAIDNKDFPPIGGPDQTMIEFLYDLDKEFKTDFDQAPNDGWQSWKPASNRLVALLQALYPDKKDSIKTGDWTADPQSWDNVIFDGQLFKFANNGLDPAAYADGRDRANPKMPVNSLCFNKWIQESDGRWRPVDVGFAPPPSDDGGGGHWYEPWTW